MEATSAVVDFYSKYSHLRDFAVDGLQYYAAELFDDTPLGEACAYSTLPAGKCLRAVLAFAAGELLGLPRQSQQAFAVAIEMIHAATLVHDDLPAMDDDHLRRGQPSSHVQYGEAAAILVGDRLISSAFQVLAQAENIDAEVRVRQIALLAEATSKVCDGQLLDLQASGKAPKHDEYQGEGEASQELIERNDSKTASLIRAALLSAVQFLPGDEATEAAQLLGEFGSKLGLLFQITDDLLEGTAATEVLGKDAGSDLRSGVPTYLSVFGLEQAQNMAQATAQDAAACLEPFGARADFLRQTVEFVLERER